MRMTAVFASVMMLAVAAPGALHAQQDVSALGSYRHARAVLDSAYVAMGGDAWKANGALTIRLTGNDYARLQSRAALPPYDPEPRVQKFVMDRNARRYYVDDKRILPGFVFWSRRVIENNRQFTLDHNENTFTTLPNAEPTVFNNRLFAIMPPELVSTVLARHAETLRWLGTTTEGGRTYDVVTFTRDGVASNVEVDRATHTVRKTSAVIDDNMTGAGETQRMFHDYQKFGAMLLPTRIAEVRGRDTIGSYKLDIALNASVPDTSFQVPPGYTERKLQAGPSRDTIFALAPDVYLVSVGYNLLAVAFDDHVFVVEAPGGLSEQAIALIQKAIPGKPIRYVALTHHHDDHAGGVRAFMGRGITVVTTPGNRPFLTRVAAAQRSLSPDALSRSPQQPKFDVIENGKRVYRDAHHVVELYDIGPGGHTNEMVIAYLPNEKILFQGDLLNIGDDKLVPTANETTLHFASRLKEMRLQPELMVGVHAGVHTMKELEQSVEKARLRGR